MTVSAVTAAQEIRRVPISDAELAYVEAGKGEPVVLVHGGLQGFPGKSPVPRKGPRSTPPGHAAACISENARASKRQLVSRLQKRGEPDRRQMADMLIMHAFEALIIMPATRALGGSPRRARSLWCKAQAEISRK
jgi:hypothetical protein